MSDFEREERAFRAALARAADGFEPQELAIPGAAEESGPDDVSDTSDEQVKAPVRRKAPWILAAAAAVLAVIGLGGVVANLQPTGSSGESTAASDDAGLKDSSGDAPKPLTEQKEAAPEGTYVDPGRKDLGAPAEGKRWAVRYDIAFQVPEEWADATAAALPECIAEPGDQWDTVPRTPYVANITNQPVPAIACNETRDRDFPAEFGKVPFALWQPYVLIEKPGEGVPAPETGSWEHEGWLLTRVQVEDAYATILTGPGDDDVNDDIKASLQTTPKDPYGCDTASPLAQGDPVRPKTKPTSSPLEGDAPDSIAICEYEPSSASLTGSREITGDDASGLVEAIRDAPARSGPNSPQNCAEGQPVTSYVILRIARDGREPGEVYVNYENCTDHGFYDGITVHALTPAACRPVFAEEPVTIYSAQGDVAKVCLS
ncbi:hypothetical protein G5C66_25165 [Nocardioides sp. KC13]|uniref:Uncharacterized protein n=1 Tax=Nocardioides turkmenicus TaxID=2711220 RepID=A0A6M1R1C8_9ACTN|nr:hypothetical protein [Nocardioides sp. KC13]NGN96015.1 hypothetical protein [Nocardioides sp. KC13]